MKVLLAVLAAVLAVATGFFVVAVVAVGFGGLLLARWVRRKYLTGHTPPSVPAQPPKPTPDGVIEIEATEIRDARQLEGPEISKDAASESRGTNTER